MDGFAYLAGWRAIIARDLVRPHTQGQRDHYNPVFSIKEDFNRVFCAQPLRRKNSSVRGS